MMSDFGNHNDFLAKKARNARRKRLRILRNRSLMDNLTPEINRNFVEDSGACKGKKRPAAADFSDFSPNVAADGINDDDDELSDESGGAERIGVLVSSACEEKESENSLINYVSYGTISLIGRRRVMEDAVTVVPGGELSIFAVYDGHGGDRVSKACGLRLHQLVLEKIDGQTMLDGCSGEREWEKVMKECFSKMDEEVNSSGSDGDGGGGMEGCSSVVTGKTVGSTAVVVVVGKKEVVVANCGDSRAVLCRGGIPVPLSHDHKPDRADERERVEAAGGRVIYWNGSRILGVLATSRSIGDEYLKPYVIAEPEVDISKRTESDEFLVIASDGLWDVVPNDLACDVARKCLNGQVRKKFNEGTNSAAAMLAELALARGSKDNISIIVVELKRCSSNLS